ncbi:MAG: sugar phosphate isomerase/epimerase [Bryobacterales bacterium]|nr:sugar phosphate isomerase/epimerase [Bryobacterales bacterium]
MPQQWTRRTLLGTLATSAGFAKSRMRAGCQTRCYGSPIRDKQKLLAVLEDLAAAGYEGFETNFASLEHSFDDPKQMVKEMAARGMKLIGLHAAPKFAIPAEVEKAKRIARAIAELGGGHFVCSTSGEIDAAATDQFGEYCRSVGVRLCLHNHLKELENGGQVMRAALEQTQPANVSAMFDLSYFSDAGLSAPEWMTKYARRIAGVHVRDHRDGKEVLLGEGKLQAREIGEALQKADWSGWVILEMNTRPDLSSREVVTRGRKFLREQMGVA